jgi:hypothetical protein
MLSLKSLTIFRNEIVKIWNRYVNDPEYCSKLEYKHYEKLIKEIELLRIPTDWKKHRDKRPEYSKKFDYCFAGFIVNIFLKNNSKLVKITKTKEKKLEKEICGICCDNHKIKNIVTTCCGHTFGKCCFEKLLNYNWENVVEISCPMCRKSNIEIIRYSDKKIKIRSTT